MIGQPWDQVSKLNQQFRNEIRRKDIQARFAQRRRQYLQQESTGESGVCDANPLIQQKLSKISDILSECPHNFGLQEIKELAKLSCSLVGGGVIVKKGFQLLGFMISKFILREGFLNTQEQRLALFILNNCLVVFGQESNSGSLGSQAQTNALNEAVTNQPFILRIMSLAMQTESQRAKQHCLSIIFCIVYNNGHSLALSLVINSKYSLINYLQSQMYTSPTKNITIQTLRIFYLVVKKLNFPNLQQLSRIKKILHMSISYSNCLEITLVCVACLHALLRAVPNERINKQNLNALELLMVQASALSHRVVTSLVLKIISLVFSSKYEVPMNNFLQFFTSCVSKQVQDDDLILVFKMMYEVIVNSLVPLHELMTRHSNLITKMDEYLHSNMTSKNVMTEVCHCMSVLAVKAKETHPSFAHGVKIRLRSIIDKQFIDEKSLPAMYSSLEILQSGMIDAEGGFE